MLVLIGMLLVLFLAMVVFAVDVSYMQLTRTELRAAADAAAKAGVECLRRTQSADKAALAAIGLAQYNKIGGKPLVLTRNDLEFGQVALLNGEWSFTPGAEPFRAMRVNASLSKESSSGPVHLLFGGLLGRSTFTPRMSAVAAQFDQDIILALDRSHSMTFDLSGVDWKYPPGIPAYPVGMTLPPHATLSRWAALMKAVDAFDDIIGQANLQPRVGIVTWSSEVTKNSVEYLLTKVTSPVIARDLEVTDAIVNGDKKGKGKKKKGLKKKIASRATSPMLGATNMSAGLNEALRMLEQDTSKPLAKKTIVLMTDGLWNQGSDPVEVARAAKSRGVVVHTITFLPGAEQDAMEQIATITGGRHYFAQNAAELEAAFRELAFAMPVLLTQ
ncbi:vWA domain-containing protein [Planctomyces sp. SH-PL14]|uniref:vWA domain-containing protein n=1 Tax=Planctomyces sp. SH-PL14 TaxID=1632864 RepID=UPI00078C3D47|nr:vWA domain-containing protein [Planctomyces sp. SH-PL14]AMV21800.1 von Willebrand factor type A domain protein [Planctomyces sp. SH-PL14]